MGCLYDDYMALSQGCRLTLPLIITGKLSLAIFCCLLQINLCIGFLACTCPILNHLARLAHCL